MQKISFDDINNFEKEKRTTFVNSLNGFKTAVLIGTKSKNGLTNLAIFNSIIHIGANPPLIGFIGRPGSVERHTIENILETGFYTINHVNEAIINQSHQTSARYSRNESEFSAAHLTELYQNDFFAPFVQESKVQISLELKEIVDLSINQTCLIIGQVIDVYIPSEIIKSDGFVDLEGANSIISCGLDSYHKSQKIKRLSYAKPNKEVKEIN